MTNYERFVQTINWELPDRIMTYDLVDHAEILKRYGGEGDLLERNAPMCKRIGLDATRYICRLLIADCRLKKWCGSFLPCQSVPPRRDQSAIENRQFPPSSASG